MARRPFSIAAFLVFAGAGMLASPATGCSSTPPAGQGPEGGADSQGASSSGGSSSGSGGSGGSSGAGSSGAGSSSSGGAALKWYFTCGDPVCQAPSGDGGSLTNDAGAPCPGIGTTCSVAGETCGTRNPSLNCGAIEQCDTHDPTTNPGGCPISSRKFKDGIRYVDSSDLEQLHDETLRLRLATYRYKPEAADPNPQHLGFIIEDTPASSPAVDRTREHVDLYGYMSMLVATMQVQENEIAELRRELQAAKSGTCH